MTIDAIRYPIGQFNTGDDITPLQRQEAINAIATLPTALRSAVRGLTDTRLNTPYRDGGWTVRQVVHHVADSHMNGYTRFKLALTEDIPVVKPYAETRWAELIDARTMPIESSLVLLDGLHSRWVTLLRAMEDADFARTFSHPEHQQEMSLTGTTVLYAWHGKHHTAHVTEFRKRMGWTT